MDEVNQWVSDKTPASLFKKKGTDLHQIIEDLLAASRHLRNPAEFIAEQAAM